MSSDLSKLTSGLSIDWSFLIWSSVISTILLIVIYVIFKIIMKNYNEKKRLIAEEKLFRRLFEEYNDKLVTKLNEKNNNVDNNLNKNLP